MNGIISRRPGAIVQWAMPTVAAILAILTGCFLFIRYPAIIHTKAIFIEPSPSESDLCADVKINSKYFQILQQKDSIDLAFRKEQAHQIVFTRVKFKIVSSPLSHQDFQIHMYLPSQKSITSTGAQTRANEPVDILLKLGSRSLKEIIF